MRTYLWERALQHAAQNNKKITTFFAPTVPSCITSPTHASTQHKIEPPNEAVTLSLDSSHPNEDTTPSLKQTHPTQNLSSTPSKHLLQMQRSLNHLPLCSTLTPSSNSSNYLRSIRKIPGSKHQCARQATLWPLLLERVHTWHGKFALFIDMFLSSEPSPQSVKGSIIHFLCCWTTSKLQLLFNDT